MTLHCQHAWLHYIYCSVQFWGDKEGDRFKSFKVTSFKNLVYGAEKDKIPYNFSAGSTNVQIFVTKCTKTLLYAKRNTIYHGNCPKNLTFFK